MRRRRWWWQQSSGCSCGCGCVGRDLRMGGVWQRSIEGARVAQTLGRNNPLSFSLSFSLPGLLACSRGRRRSFSSRSLILGQGLSGYKPGAEWGMSLGDRSESGGGMVVVCKGGGGSSQDVGRERGRGRGSGSVGDGSLSDMGRVFWEERVAHRREGEWELEKLFARAASTGSWLSRGLEGLPWCS